MSISEILQWIVLVFLFFATAGTSSSRLHRKALREIVRLLLKLSKGEIPNSADVNSLKELEYKLGP